MNRNEAGMKQIAENYGLGTIEWVHKIALNTGRPMTVGYVWDEIQGRRELFCKSDALNGGFHLCNEYRKLDEE